MIAARNRRALLSHVLRAWLILLAAGSVVLGGIVVAGGSLQAFIRDFVAPLTRMDSFRDLAMRACPLCLCALATTFPGRLGLLNIGVQGQMIVGCILATGVSLVTRLPAYALIATATAAGAVGGALWAVVPAALRAYGRMNEAVTSLMLNYVGWFAALWLINGVWREKTARGWPQTDLLHLKAQLPECLGVPSLVFIGLFLPLLVALASCGRAWTFHTDLIRHSPEAARSLGIRVKMHQLTGFALGGACAGLAGAIEVLAVHDRLRDGVWGNYAFAGILLAWLCAFNFLFLLAGAIGMAGLLGALDGQLVYGVPFRAFDLFIGLALLALAASQPIAEEPRK